MKKIHSNRVIIPGDGDPCPRCKRPMQIREHAQITAEHRMQRAYYTRWFFCTHEDCRKREHMPDRYRVINPL